MQETLHRQPSRNLLTSVIRFFETEWVRLCFFWKQKPDFGFLVHQPSTSSVSFSLLCPIPATSTNHIGFGAIRMSRGRIVFCYLCREGDVVGYIAACSKGKLRILQGRIPKAARLFTRDESGSLIIFSLFMFILTLLIAGMAVDLMRAETQRARLQNTLDRAVLAGASLEQTLDGEEVVRDYFAKAGLADYLTSVSVTVGDNTKTARATAKMDVDSYFMKLMGINNITAPAGGTAEESLSNIEISLILDISGSMSWNSATGYSKIYELKKAAKEFVYQMICNPDDAGDCTVEPNTVSISIVPYAEQVLVGEDLLSYFNATNEQTVSSCVDFAEADFSTTSVTTTQALQRTGHFDDYSRSNRSPYYWTCKNDSYREITLFSSNYSDLQTKIDDLNPGGFTSIDIGMKWGVALLDPAIRSIITDKTSGGSPEITADFAGRPYDFNARSMQKVVVLMTDGENTTQNMLNDGYRSGPSPVYQNSSDGKLSIMRASDGKYYWPHLGEYFDEPYGDGATYTYDTTSCSGWGWSRTCWTTTHTGTAPGTANQLTFQQLWTTVTIAYWDALPSSLGLGDPSTSYGYTEKNTRLDSICTAAKGTNDPIEVFTIGFETSWSSAQILANCASSDAHNFTANGYNIEAAFASIAREIHELRLVN